MLTDIEQFLLWERTTRDTIDFKKIYVDITGDIIAGLMLSEIVYWHIPSRNGDTKLRIEHNGIQWIAVRRYEWWDRTRINPRQADKALNVLVELGLVAKDVFKFNGDPTTHVALIWEKFLPAIRERTENPIINPFSPIGENEITNPLKPNHQTVITISPNGDNDLTHTLIPVTETTSEITTEIQKIRPHVSDERTKRTPPPAPRFPIDVKAISEDEEPDEPEIVIHLNSLFKSSKLTAPMIKRLTEKVSITERALEKPVSAYPSPAELYASDSLFKQFVLYAIKYQKAEAKKVGKSLSRDLLTKHIQGYGWSGIGWLAYEAKMRPSHIDVSSAPIVEDTNGWDFS